MVRLVGHRIFLDHKTQGIPMQRQPKCKAKVGSDTEPLDRIVATLGNLPKLSFRLELLSLVCGWHFECNDPVLEAVQPVDQVV